MRRIDDADRYICPVYGFATLSSTKRNECERLECEFRDATGKCASRTTKLYSVYRTKDDALIVFEQPVEKVAEIMGFKKQTIYEHLCKQKAGKLKKPSFYICVTDVQTKEERK